MECGEPNGISWLLLIAQSHSSSAITARTRKAGMTPGQPKILQFLASHDGCTQKELGRGCALDKSSVTGLLARMEANGLIRRDARAEDRREVVVHLTAAGERLARIAIENAEVVDARALRGFDKKDRATLSTLLGRVINNLTQPEGDA